MKLGIVLFQITGSKSNLHYFTSKGVDLIAISSTEIAHRFSNESKQAFTDFYVTDEIQAKLFSVIEQNLNQYNEIFVATIDESCLLLAAKAREYFHLLGAKPSEILPFVNKLAMKDALLDSQIRIPKYRLFDKQAYLLHDELYLKQIEDNISFPLFVKPIDQYGSMNARRINSHDEFEQWALTVVDDHHKYEVDEFIEGTLLHCDSIIENGKILFTAIGEMNAPLVEFSQGKAIGSFTLAEYDFRHPQIERFNQQVINALNPPDGTTHLELFHTNTGELIFLEIAARPPGGYVINSYKDHFDINFEKVHYQLQMQLPVNIVNFKNELYHTWLYIPNVEGIVAQLHSPQDSIKSNFEISWFSQIGHYYSKSTDVRPCHVAGIIALTNKNYEELYKDFIELTEFKFISTVSEGVQISKETVLPYEQPTLH